MFEEITISVIYMAQESAPFQSMSDEKQDQVLNVRTLSYLNFHAAVCEPLDTHEIENIRCCYFR